MKPVQSERYGRLASRVEGFRGWRALSAGLTWGASRYVGGSAATPTQCGLIAAGRMPIKGLSYYNFPSNKSLPFSVTLRMEIVH